MTTEALVLSSSPIMTVGYLMQVILSLAIVLGLIFVIARYLLPRLKVAPGGKLIQVADRVMLEPQLTAYVLKVKGKSWLVVAGSKGVAAVGEVEAE
ncbi:MAG: hypothetical protein WC529_05420 [Candidatus Margulisiibacteriota bacterium]